MPVGTCAVRVVEFVYTTFMQYVVPIRTVGVAMKLSPLIVTSVTRLLGPLFGTIVLTTGGGGPSTVRVTSKLEVWPSGLVTLTGQMPAASVPGV